MNKYHNRNRIISLIMTIHDILTLHILSSSLPLFLSSLSLFPFLSFFPFSFLSLLLPFLLYPPSLYSLSLLLPFLSLSLFSPLRFLCLLS